MSTDRSRLPGCDCCSGTGSDTPQRIANPPGQPSISYRAGRHGDFLASIQARLSSADYPALAGLGTRESSDFTLALADALASSLDVLSFYTERIAQEHYLRTATERLSVGELARLIGYRLAPGVAAGTHLAFTLQDTPGAPQTPTTTTTIPAGTRVQSVPGQGETAQTFETIAEICARAEWNAMPARTTEAWWPRRGDTELWLEGVATGLSPGDAILIVGLERQRDPGSERWDVRVLSAVEPDIAGGRTRLRWTHPLGSAFPAMTPASLGAEVHALRQRTALFGHNAPDANLFGNADSNIAQLIDTSSAHWNWKNFALDPAALDLDTDNPKIVGGSWIALVSNEAGRGSADLPGYTELYRVRAVAHRSRNAFGISGKVTRITPDTAENLTASRFPLRRTLVLAQSERLTPHARPLRHPVQDELLTLGVRAEGLQPGQAIAVSGTRQRIAIAAGAASLVLATDDGAAVPLSGGDELFMLAAAARLIGGSAVALDGETFVAQLGRATTRLRLRLLDRGGRAGTLEANASELALAPARKDDARVAEIAWIADTATAVTHDRDDTTLTLAAPLKHVFARASLRVNANVAPATHGETIEAILGDGDASHANQRFRLAQAPLTYVSASTPSGRRSTLALRVDDVLWTERASVYAASAGARAFETWEDDEGHTHIQFGDGIEGARLPSGTANVRVRYRKGIGAGGNVGAGTLTTLLSRPLGVGEASNPEAASGGEDPETIDHARDSAPLTVLTLDRALSITDYANFARAFAGIDKAHALWIPAGPARGVFVTIAGIGGARVEADSDTYRHLFDALRTWGDPLVPLRLENHIDARFRCRVLVRALDGFEPAAVVAAVRVALLARFAFAARAFGQTVSLDEIAAAAQGVRGVEAAHVARLHRSGQPSAQHPRLFATLPQPSLTAVPAPAELLTLATNGLEVEVLP
ncbi:hypothetical protein CGK74_06135 [Thauera propionica]|uniref:Uncharacterized protein n=1 Tax=Thauera propionica TaxID=2019431 RepID=A0A235EZG2_9RHOO|nr:baseplate J/gp47 family protein [Thauera propionica]OYD54380.1 hypothetical protein CGK74_06135 [Thauera propionica]